MEFGIQTSHHSNIFLVDRLAVIHGNIHHLCSKVHQNEPIVYFVTLNVENRAEDVYIGELNAWIRPGK